MAPKKYMRFIRFEIGDFGIWNLGFGIWILELGSWTFGPLFPTQIFILSLHFYRLDHGCIQRSFLGFTGRLFADEFLSLFVQRLNLLLDL
jgi:hypothetical protein